MKTSIAWLLVLLVVSIAILPHSFVDAKSKDSKAKSAIIKAIGKAVEGKYASIKLVQISKSNVSSYITVYNTTKALPPVPTPVPPTPIPPQPIPENASTTKVCLVGDLKGSSVPNMMKDCNYKIGLGDLGYASDLSYFKGLKFDKCVVGNHDSSEDKPKGSNIDKEALAYCGDHWSLKIGTATLIIGMNTNGIVDQQVQAVKTAILQNTGVKSIILVSHKGGHVPPNSHHPAEASKLYQQLEQIIPTSMKVTEIFGHNHVSSSAPSKNWYQAGAGGKSFYSCGQDQIWTYCDNTHEGYLELTISNIDGATAAKFIK
jgi:hypothetical protein